ncbi:MAG: hypothetical protein KF830_12735 [Planctomycetes bacterium]|nr:hypothetical protein [Planctomycetota bacterium]
MPRPSRCAATAIAVTVTGLVPLAAQAASGGVLAGAPVAVLVDGGLAAGGDAETRVHRNGFTLQPTAALPVAPSSADLRQILAAHGAPPGLDVDDFSTGRDDVLFDGNGVLAVPPSSWGVLSFSLRHGATGAPGSRIAQQAVEGDVGATLFAWVLPGSNVPAQLVGRTERSHSRQELGLPATAPEVDGIDVPLLLGLDQAGLLQLDPGFLPLIQSPQAIYFTVSHATRHLVPAAWWSFGGQATLASGATILRVLKSAPLGPWSPPHAFAPYGVLGLDRDEDIDGLAYDEVRQKLLFSVVGIARDQFLFVDLGSDGVMGPVDAKMPNGVDKISEHVGKAQSDDVDAICTLDPRIGTIGAPPPAGDDFGSSCGSPRQGLLGVPQVHAAAHRRREGNQTFYDTWLIGWPPVTGQGPGIAALFVTFDPDLTLHPFSIQLRDPAALVPGDPRHFPLLVPPALELSGFSFTFRWAAMDLAISEIAEAWPLQVFL